MTMCSVADTPTEITKKQYTQSQESRISNIPQGHNSSTQIIIIIIIIIKIKIITITINVDIRHVIFWAGVFFY